MSVSEKEKIPPIPATIQQILNDNNNSSLSHVEHDNGRFKAWRVTMKIAHLYNVTATGSCPDHVVWLIDEENKVISKLVYMTVPKYDLRKVARYFIEGKRVFNIHRMTRADQCWELQAILGDITVEWFYSWDVGTTIFPTLEKEFDINVTMLQPCQTLFTSLPYLQCYHRHKTEPPERIPVISNMLLQACNQQRLLLYTFNKSDKSQQIGKTCNMCLCVPCVWINNKNAVTHDNLELGERPGQFSREFAIMQFRFILTGFGPVNTTEELPKCVVQGISTIDDNDYSVHI